MQAGQPILVLDNARLRAALDAARAEARRDEVTPERFTFPQRRGAVSARERDSSVTQAITSRDQARVREADLAYKVVRAPISGLIGNLSSVQLRDVVRTGEAITCSGQVVVISPFFGILGSQQSPDSGLVKAPFANPCGELKAGMVVRNRIITSRRRELSVPVLAVQMQAQQPFVFRVVPLAQVLPDIRESHRLPEAQKRKLEALPPASPVVVQSPVQIATGPTADPPATSGPRRWDLQPCPSPTTSSGGRC